MFNLLVATPGNYLNRSVYEKPVDPNNTLDHNNTINFRKLTPVCTQAISNALDHCELQPLSPYNISNATCHKALMNQVVVCTGDINTSSLAGYPIPNSDLVLLQLESDISLVEQKEL